MKSAHNRYRKPARENPTDSPPIVVGQTLYREVTHKHRPTAIIETTVVKIGSKYFYVDGIHSNEKFDKKSLYHRSDCSSEYSIQLYRTKQEVLDAREWQSLWIVLRNHFSYGGKGNENTLEQLRAVAKVAGIDVKEST